ncbi:DUF397 domain-containing protein [Actinocrispum wychmicini]|uniref:Uncharacterized protein DUF397 n=1 Tax=Actinocrispum wychmicini TaxID=1213861 RepID=A0A4R2J3A9_9PSEU|nr:DUF397 domain-containing protein [Actinocrispum wychmicini]TCO52424.1 uncharacterized protein DUF397 [Actinocrispum wychmicini]
MRAAASGTWFTSSFSGSSGANCVEVRFTGTDVQVRDSKNRGGPQVQFGAGAWSGFVSIVPGHAADEFGAAP